MLWLTKNESCCPCGPIPASFLSDQHSFGQSLTHCSTTNCILGSGSAAYNASSYGAQAGKAPSSNVAQLCWGELHGLSLLQNGQVAAWGDNTFGQTTLPPALANGSPVHAVRIACGSNFSLALLSNGSLIGW
jgi:alpha-tubulin suppressor-like RCC1 family protein